MGKINVSRVILGGLLAGVVINLSEFLVNGVWLMDDWNAAMMALNKPGGFGGLQIATLNSWGFAVGIAAIWLYAAIRPRFGPGPRTALIAGLATWIIGYLLSGIPGISMGLFPAWLMVIGICAGVVEVLIGALLGAWVYKEGPAVAG